MSATRTRQGLDPARASHWRVLLSALDERARASGGYRSAERPILFAAGFPAATGGFSGHVPGVYGSFLFRLAEAIRRVSARYLDITDFDRANAAHPPQVPSSWNGVRCPVDGPPDPGLAIGSTAMARFMERCADAIGAMVATKVGQRYTSTVVSDWDAAAWQYVNRFSDCDGEPVPIAAPVPGEFRAFARKYRSLGEFHALGTGLARDAWTSLGSVSEPGGHLLFPSAPIDPDSAGADWHPTVSFQADFYLFPTFAPIQPPSGE